MIILLTTVPLAIYIKGVQSVLHSATHFSSFTIAIDHLENPMADFVF